MANDARISTALPIHPKTVKLQRRLGVEAGWFLVRLFLWVADNRYDGDLKGLTTEDIEIAVGWQGDLGAFVRALVEVGFLEGKDNGYCVHDWAEHNPWAANRPKRQAAARAANSVRWAIPSEPDASRIRTGCDSDDSGIPPTQPNPTQLSPTQPDPNPDDGEAAFNAQEVAVAICRELRIAKSFDIKEIETVIENEHLATERDRQEIGDSMIAAWKEFDAIPTLERRFDWPAAAFFTKDQWRRRDSWRKPSEKPKERELTATERLQLLRRRNGRE